MVETEIPEFVQALIEAGAGICAVGRDGYVIGDADLDDPEVLLKIHNIAVSYGERDHLRAEISAHLRSLGRHAEISFLTG